MKNNYTLEYFSKSVWSFALIRNGEIIYKSKSQRLEPLIFCVKNYPKQMKGALVYDKIIGLAAATLLKHGGAKEVWTPTLSQAGKEYLEKNKIKNSYLKITGEIKNQKGDDICPMEKMIRKLGEKEFIRKILS